MCVSRFWSVCFAIIFSLPQYVLAQKTEHSITFDQLLDQANLEIFEPVDAGYRAFEPLENEFLNCQYALNSNREDLQLRYYVLPWSEQDTFSTIPNLAAFWVVTSVASNADDNLISAMQLDPDLLINEFNADWGMLYFFAPKPAFSTATGCKLLALSKEGQGTAFVFFFFDDAGNQALNQREMAVRFK